jgi:valyl-tRNA synthetase
MGSGASATPILPGQGHFYCYDTHPATIWSVDPGSGSIDVAAQRARLGKDLAAANKELSDPEAKLANPKFTERAPANIVAGIHARRHTANANIERIQAALDALSEA